MDLSDSGSLNANYRVTSSISDKTQIELVESVYVDVQEASNLLLVYVCILNETLANVKYE